VVAAGLPVAGILMCLGLAACAGSSPQDCPDPLAADFPAAGDSLGLEEFTALEPAQRRQRRDRADEWLARSRHASKAGDRVRALAKAAGLAPDDPEIWLQLADIWRWIGENLRTEACLDNAAAAVRNLGRRGSDFFDRPGGYKKNVALRTGLLRAWLHYDRAEYHEGLDWARAAAGLEPGNALGWQILGLLEGRLGHRSQAHEAAGNLRRARVFNTDSAWILSTLDSTSGRHREAIT
jgi:tetratricopeptide (TPR) repeat protein